jgi:hypothetical protein
MRKLIALVIAMCVLGTSLPVPSFAKEKDKKEHKSRKQRKELKRQKKQYEKIRSRANDYREKPGKHVGEHMLKNQTPKEQKERKKHHLKPEGGTY